MKMLVTLCLCALAATPVASDAQRVARRSEAQKAFEGTRSGQLLPLRDIERHVVPTMPGAQYLGPDFDGDSAIYTLKFLRNGMVIWVQVDGRSGQVVGRTGR
ncbi:MAG: hypothetical protein ABIS14_04260 [Sphingomonas sp.]